MQKNNLKTVLQQLKSDKIKERQEGINSIRSVFAQDKVVAKFHLNSDGVADPRNWLVVFQALFTAVLQEKAACTKKATAKSAGTSAAALRRLGDAAAAVRWMTERTVHLLNKRVVKAVLEHLLQTMVHKGELLTPVALDYIKALRCLMGWAPHVDHMDDDTWVRMLEMGFNVVLGDPVRKSFEDDGDEQEAPVAETEDEGREDFDDEEDLFVDDDENDGDRPSTSTQSKKRRRREFNETPRSSKPKSQMQAPRRPAPISHSPSISLEQIEFTSLLSLLLRPQSAPLLSPSFPHLGSSILNRLQRFLSLYPTDTSLHHDYLLALSATLSHLALNKKDDVERFACSAWDGLVGLWGTKNKLMKESLISVLYVLFPFFTAKTNPDWGDGVTKLWQSLAGESDTRWGVDSLSFDSLRLEVVPKGAEESVSESAAFSARTFRAGWGFDAGQALAWSILELQADCAEKLFQLAESHRPSTASFIPSSSSNEKKRIRLENPILFLLSPSTSTQTRINRLQVLLFFTDRHWSILHDDLQQDVLATLLQFVSSDDGVIQSWVFMCFASIAYREYCTWLDSQVDDKYGTSDNGPGHQISDLSPRAPHRSATSWDPIWTHAIRRANVPTVCRAACHVAYTLLAYSYSRSAGPFAEPVLTSQRVLLEIETFAKDLDVQGPTFPYDSVCMFLTECLRIASQDARLYRMQLEEKVLSWFVDCWPIPGVGGALESKPRGDVGKMPSHLIRDVLLLLESISGFSTRSDFVCRVLLPDCMITDIIGEDRRAKVIRDFLLDAKLPRFRKAIARGAGSDLVRGSLRPPKAHTMTKINDRDLIPPRGRERKVSALLLKCLEGLVLEWEGIKESGGHTTAEKARRSIDIAITALSYEFLLVSNGTRYNRRVVQCSCKVVLLVSTLLTDARWSTEEKALVLLGLEPLTSTGEEDRERIEEHWDVILPPNKGTGIKTRTLRALTENWESKRDQVITARRNFQMTIWQSADVQDVFVDVMNTLKDLLRIVVGDTPTHSSIPHATDVDDKDGFGPIRTTRQFSETQTQKHSVKSTHCLVEVCMSYLSIAPILQSLSGEATRDKDLTELILGCAELQPEKFILVSPIFFDKVRQKTLNLSMNNFNALLDSFESLLQPYSYARSERLQFLITQFLYSTMHIWLSDPAPPAEVGEKVRQFCQWLSQALGRNKIRSWKIRDFLARFLDRYLSYDPSQLSWSISDDTTSENQRRESLPSIVLPSLGADEDIRVRFRAAVLNARLFTLARVDLSHPNDLYVNIKEHYTIDVENYEHMLTRMLSLGNIMVVSSAVRRGPYWHLLETLLQHDSKRNYANHIEAILRAVSVRMGLPAFRVLFETYASQIAYSIREAKGDFLRFPPDLLGYADRKDCARAAFRSFAPTNLVAGGSHPETILHGRRLFARHCSAVSSTPKDGIRRCFGDIVGFQIASWMNENPDSSHSDLESLLRTETMFENDPGSFDDVLGQSGDAIVVAILRTLGDQDPSTNGSIFITLQSRRDSSKAASVFQALVRYRTAEDFNTHEPNLPSFGAQTVLQALDWFNARFPNMQTKATAYHLMHNFFADIQRSPLVNEQYRLINGICSWIALHHSDFQEPVLLHTLLHGATNLLAQSDLARAAQSILEWALGCYRTLAIGHPRFPDILIRICSLAYDYSVDIADPAVSNLGKDLLQWIDMQALKLCSIDVLQPQVIQTLPAWLHQPSSQLHRLCESFSTQSLSAVLNDHRISSNKFRLVRLLRGAALTQVNTAERFATTDFWKLKECIPPDEQLQIDDVDAFAALLVVNHGRINSFGGEQSSAWSRKHSMKDGVSPRTHIIHSLLAMLNVDVASQVHVAYRTLRLLISTSVSHIPQFQIRFEHQKEVEYLQTYSCAPESRPARDITELSSSEPYLEAAKDFPQWIGMVTTLLSDILSSSDAFYAQLTSILQSDVSFAEQTLPVLVYAILMESNSPRIALSEYFTAVLRSEHVAIQCVRATVDIVLFLRHFNPINSSDALARDKWLDIDFTLLAQKALVCGAYTTSLLFLELGADYGESASTEVNNTSEQILYNIYSHIDEPDGFYGIQTKNLHQFLIKRFHHEKQWEKAFRFHGAALEAGRTDSSAAEGLLQSFHSFGFNHLAMDTLQSSSIGDTTALNASGMSYQLGWRTDTWDLPDQMDRQSKGASLYLALQAIYRERDPGSVDAVIRRVFFQELGRLRALGAESLAEIREVIQNLMCLNQVTQWRGPLIQGRLAVKHVDLDEWINFVHIDPNFEFSNLESIMATRISLVRSAMQKEQREQIGPVVTPFMQDLINVEKQCLIRLSEAARESNQIQIALNSVVRAQRLEKLPSFDVSQEFASVLWLQKEQKLAVQFLKELAAGNTSQDVTKKALLLARLGEWTSEGCLEKPTDILSHFFDPATSLVKDFDATRSSDLALSHATVYHQFALFAEQQYHSAILKSSDAVRWDVYVKRKVDEIKRRNYQIEKTQRGTKEYLALDNDQKKAQRQLATDNESFQKHIRARDAFLQQAIDMYARCLETSDAFDDDGAIRLCSLWFANFDDVALQENVRCALGRVPSRKLVFLAHQLSARLSKSQVVPMAKNQANLQDLVLRMCAEHPFHSLYQVYCLQPDRSTMFSSRRQSDRHSPTSTQTERSAAAGDIFDKLRGDPNVGERVRAVEAICDASLQWAKFPIKQDPRYSQGKTNDFKVPDNLLIQKISGVKVPVVTVHTPLDPTLRYDDCIWIERYGSRFSTAGGVNLPKIGTCYGSNGEKYKQLYKGEGGDDLRQDAVMEQVFDLVNRVLRRDRETRRRNLSVRDYRVIPLGTQAGVLEFVEKTTPFRNWILTAHAKYQPEDLKPNVVSAQFRNKQKECDNMESIMVPFFLELRKRFKPVMRHYFTERHKTPISWFSMRLNYTRSVATTSVVGHILGLGDRHISNILLDNVSGEVVHIDLGIAFDQGKLLPIPERVPFRMTADVVDGMGTAGTQGVFQRCAEETLRVLRAGSDVITTVLEVFKHDPLHSWTASDVKLLRVQGSAPAPAPPQQPHDTARFGIGIDMSSGSADEAADRALSSVARKLDRALSVEYTVNELIAEATDPANLATIFHGWSPYC